MCNITVLGVMRSKGLSQEIALQRAREPEFFHRLPQPLQPKPKTHRPELIDREINKSISSMLQQANVNHQPKDIRRERRHLFLKLAHATVASPIEQYRDREVDATQSKEDLIRAGRSDLGWLWFDSHDQETHPRGNLFCADSCGSSADPSRFDSSFFAPTSSLHS